MSTDNHGRTFDHPFLQVLNLPFVVYLTFTVHKLLLYCMSGFQSWQLPFQLNFQFGFSLSACSLASYLVCLSLDLCWSITDEELHILSSVIKPWPHVVPLIG